MSLGLFVALYAAGHYPIGQAARMGPGFFPVALGWILAGLGLAIALLALRKTVHVLHPPPFALRPLIAVPASMATFSLLVTPLGLVPATFALVFVAAFAERKFRLRRTRAARPFAGRARVAHLHGRPADDPAGVHVPGVSRWSSSPASISTSRSASTKRSRSPTSGIASSASSSAASWACCPGWARSIAISLLLPITYHLPATGALIMLAGVYFGADYGGGTCSILLGVPGHPAAAVDVLDGYPMAQQGRGGIALFMKCVASFWGSAVGIVLLMLFAPVLAEVALKFGPAEYCALMLLGPAGRLVRGTGLAGQGRGHDGRRPDLSASSAPTSTAARRASAFGVPELTDGIGLIAIAMGLFAITEVIKSAGKASVTVERSRSSRCATSCRPARTGAAPGCRCCRGSGLGAFFGALPGTSGGMATFLAYAIEKRISKHPEQFGKGAIEGIAAPEACNNAGRRHRVHPDANARHSRRRRSWR